jgi:superfamily II DNA or RNA helicase
MFATFCGNVRATMLQLQGLLAILSAFEFVTLGPYQDAVIEYIYKREMAGLGGVLVLGCGFGKTFMAIAIVLIMLNQKQHDAGKTLWIMPANLVGQVAGNCCKYLAKQQLQDMVVVLQTQDFSNLKPDSIALVSYTMLEKLESFLVAAGFKRVVVGKCRRSAAGTYSILALPVTVTLRLPRRLPASDS